MGNNDGRSAQLSPTTTIILCLLPTSQWVTAANMAIPCLLELQFMLAKDIGTNKAPYYTKQVHSLTRSPLVTWPDFLPSLPNRVLFRSRHAHISSYACRFKPSQSLRMLSGTLFVPFNFPFPWQQAMQRGLPNLITC